MYSPWRILSSKDLIVKRLIQNQRGSLLQSLSASIHVHSTLAFFGLTKHANDNSDTHKSKFENKVEYQKEQKTEQIKRKDEIYTKSKGVKYNKLKFKITVGVHFSLISNQYGDTILVTTKKVYQYSYVSATS